MKRLGQHSGFENVQQKDCEMLRFNLAVSHPAILFSPARHLYCDHRSELACNLTLLQVTTPCTCMCARNQYNILLSNTGFLYLPSRVAQIAEARNPTLPNTGFWYETFRTRLRKNYECQNFSDHNIKLRPRLQAIHQEPLP